MLGRLTNDSTEARDARRLAHGFGLLGDALAGAPCAALLAALRGPEVAALFSAYAIPFCIDALPGADGAKLFTWICEFDRLFNERGDPLLPYEAIYVRGAGPGQWGSRADAVRDVVTRWRIEPRPPGRRLDHVGVELNVASALAALEAELASRGEHTEARRAQAARRAFEREHLVPWLPTLAADIRDRAHIFVYRDLLQLAVALVRDDVSTLPTNDILSPGRAASCS